MLFYVIVFYDKKFAIFAIFAYIYTQVEDLRYIRTSQKY